MLFPFHEFTSQRLRLPIHSQTRTASQIRSHAQKYFEKLKYQNRCDEELSMVGNPTEKDALMVLDYIENTLDKLKRKRDEQVNLWQRAKITSEGNSEKDTQIDETRENIRRLND